MPASPDLRSFEIDSQHGYLPSRAPLRKLPAKFAAWEEVAADLPKLLVSTHLRDTVKRMPLIDAQTLKGDEELRRAMLLLSFIGHGYVWGEGEHVSSIPDRLAVPWHAVATRLGRPPILSYASYALDNWRKIDEKGPIAIGNIALLQNFLAGIDEEWFVLVHIDIEAKAGPALLGAAAAEDAAGKKDEAGVLAGLRKIEKAMAECYAVMERMPENCDPYIYYNRVRPYIHGWKNHPQLPNGILYEGVGEYKGKPQQFRGETGAQSGIVPALDAALGVAHADDPLRPYLLEMRNYMPPRHRAFLEALENGPSVREFVKTRKPGELRDVYNACVEHVEKFRSLHLQYAHDYIYGQHEKHHDNPSKVGTGGTPFMQYLTKHRDETGASKL